MLSYHCIMCIWTPSGQPGVTMAQPGSAQLLLLNGSSSRGSSLAGIFQFTSIHPCHVFHTYIVYIKPVRRVPRHVQSGLASFVWFYYKFKQYTYSGGDYIATNGLPPYVIPFNPAVGRTFLNLSNLQTGRRLYT